jgi:hypothetical protein
MQNSKTFQNWSKMLRLQKSFTTYKWGININNEFIMNQHTFKNSYLFQNDFKKNTSCIGTTISIHYEKLQKQLFQNSFVWKKYFYTKGHVLFYINPIGSLYLVCTLNNFFLLVIMDKFDLNLVFVNVKLTPYKFFVATLALGSRPRQRGCKGAGQREAQESHQGLPGV